MAKTDPKLEAASLYADLMNEVKVRIAAIDAGTGGLLGALPAPIVQEHCYLQLRMCCELIALGCLVAHGDITAGKGLKDKWEPHKIMAALDELHPHFFPQPVSSNKFPTHRHLEGIKQGVMTKADLLSLYNRCGGRLHRGNLNKLMKQSKIPTQVNYPEITKCAQSIVDLLNHHIVMMLGGQQMFICVLRVMVDGREEVQVATANATPPPEFATAQADTPDA